jgi:hypothetical protein
MIIHDLDIFGTGFRPSKADSPLIVDSDAVLPGAITLQSLQTISRRNSQVIQTSRNFELPELATGHSLDIDESRNPPSLGKRLGLGASERLDHAK